MSRTFPEHSLFKNDGSGVASLCNVLVCFSMYREDIGYHQGLNYIAGVLITILDEEVKICVLCVCI